MKKNTYFMVVVVIALFLLGACGSNEKEAELEQPQEEMNQEEERNEEELEETEQENEELAKGEIVFSILESNSTPVEELDENRWIKITNEDLIGEKIIYGAGELVAFKLNRTFRYDVASGKELWELRVTSPDEIISLKDGVSLTTGFKIREIALKEGKVLSEIEFAEEEVESYNQFNAPYRLGEIKTGIRVTNEETNDVVDILEVEPGEYVPSVLLETKTVTLEDTILKSFDNETGELLAEQEVPKKSQIYGRTGQDEVYVVYSPVENQYGYQIMLLDANTLETKNEIDVKNANEEVIVTDEQVFYYDVIDGELVALNLDLTKENYRFVIGGEMLDYTIHNFAVYDEKLYLHIMEQGNQDYLRMLEIDSTTGEVEQDVAFPTYNLIDFYALAGKLYLKFETGEGEYYYIVDQEDVHRSMD